MARKQEKFKGVQWLRKPEPKDYSAAQSYLALMFPPKRAARFIESLRDADIEEFKAKDIFRASGLPLLPVTNSHVEKDLKRILAGESLSPLLLIRMPEFAKVIIADGYHRLCAVYSLDENAVIPCKIA
jgi:hypothetical protein